MDRNSWKATDAGESLIEVLLAVLLLGTSVVFIVSSLGTSIHTTSFNRSQAQVSTTLASAAEWVKAQGWQSSCADSGPSGSNSISTAQVNNPNGYTVTVSNAGALSASIPCSKGLQERQVTVTKSGNTGMSQSVLVVIRQP